MSKDLEGKQPDLSRTTVDPEYDDLNLATEDAEDILDVAFRTMDRGVKEYFSNIVVPTKDSFKKLEVRVAGGDKTILFWKQDLESGRIGLPIMSVNRTGWQFNPGRNTPAEAGSYYYRNFADMDGTRMLLSPREYPVLIDYVLSIWAERKRDIEYIQYQIITRFNPLAEWTVEDEFFRGNMFATFEGATDNSDIDIDANQLAKVRYDLNIKAEGWLPAPTNRIVPTVLGKVNTLDELDTREFLDVIKINPRGI